MAVSLRRVRELLERRAAGLLSDGEQAELVRDARVLRRRLERLQALDPEAYGELALSAELDELAQPPVLSGSA